MTTCVLTCETCSTRKPFPMGEHELAAAQNGKTLSKHCPVCRAVTHWMFTCLERRGGERRQNDRRS